MGNRNDPLKQPECDKNDPLRETDLVRGKQRKHSLQPSLHNSPNSSTPERRPSLPHRVSNLLRLSIRKKQNSQPNVDDLSSHGSQLASVTPQNVRRTSPGLNATDTSLGCSRSNSFIIHGENSSSSGYQEHQEKKQTIVQQNFNQELVQKLALRQALPHQVTQPSPRLEIHLPEEYSRVKDLIHEGDKSQSQLQISSTLASAEGSGFSSLPNSLVRKSRTETLAGSLPRKQNPIVNQSDFHHFNSINNASFRHKSRSNAEQPKLNDSHSNPNTIESGLNRSQDSAKMHSNPNTIESGLNRSQDSATMHRRGSVDKIAVDVRGFGQGQPGQQRQMNIARGEGVAIPKRQVASSVSPLGSPKGSKGSPSQNENDVKKYYVAKDCWNGRGDLDVKQNEKLEYITTLDDGSWYMRSCVTGSKGTLPSYILAPVDLIENRPWFFKNLGRSSAEEKLKLAGKHGTFLVRESESTPNEFSLSILDGDTVKHYRIRKHDTGGYFVELTYQFATLQDLVSFYSKEPRGLCSRLAIPCSKEIIRQEKVIDEWELDRSLLEIRSVLGRGQYGVVREAILTIPGTNQRVRAAVKELKKGRNELAEFQKEVNALKTLRHERLIMLYGVCTQVEPYYIVTEFLKNKSLLDYIKGPEGRYLSLEEMLHIALQVAEGMTYLESQNYVHRDLAARNVLLDDRLNSKIADFGMVSKSMKGNNLATTDTEHERLPIKWTALEALAEGKFTSKSDVWSFGVLLTEIITRGVTPYKDMDNSEVLDFLVKGNRMPQPPCMEDQCYNITLECWARNPDNRPSFYELQQKLTNYIRVVKLSRNNNAFAPEYHG